MTHESNGNGNGSLTKFALGIFAALVTAGALAWAGTGSKAYETAQAVKNDQALLEYRVSALETAMRDMRADVARAAQNSEEAAASAKATWKLVEQRERRERGER